MNTKKNKLIILIALLFLGSGLLANTNGRVVYRGYARSMENGKLLYTENHYENWRSGKHTHSLVDYRKPDGSLMARKRIKFFKSADKPDFKIEDKRSGAVSGATHLAGNRYQLFSKKDKADALKKSTVNLPRLSVIDGGFDNHIRQNFELYSSGKSRVVAFVSADRRDYFRFRVQPVAGSAGGPLVLNMYPESLLLRGLVGTIQLKYDRKLKRLLEYRGISNIEDDNGDTQKVVIRFSYKGVDFSASGGL